MLTTSRIVYANNSESLVLNTFNVIFNKTPQGYLTTGEIMRQAKNNTINGANFMNTRKYLLLGDPTMKLSYPEYHVKTTRVNGQAMSVVDTFKALERVTIEGQIIDEQGQIATDYNGIIYPTVYDKADRFFTLGNDNDSYVDDFLLRKKYIFKGQASVQNGNFSFSFVVPKDINYQIGYGKISYYSHSNIEWQEASGYSYDIKVGGSSTNFESDNTVQRYTFS